MNYTEQGSDQEFYRASLHLLVIKEAGQHLSRVCGKILLQGLSAKKLFSEAFLVDRTPDVSGPQFGDCPRAPCTPFIHSLSHSSTLSHPISTMPPIRPRASQEDSQFERTSSLADPLLKKKLSSAYEISESDRVLTQLATLMPFQD